MRRISVDRGEWALYLVIAGIFVVMKLLYSHCTLDALRDFLVPLDGMVKLVTNSHSVYLPAQGFYHEKLHILINKSCSGFNFFALCFIMLAFLSVRRLPRTAHKFLALPASLVLAYVLTLFVNCARILTAVALHGLSAPLSPQQAGVVHQAEGAFVYLFFLLVIYTAFNFILIKKVGAHAKSL